VVKHGPDGPGEIGNGFRQDEMNTLLGPREPYV
jgi:hypothetical protein